MPSFLPAMSAKSVGRLVSFHVGHFDASALQSGLFGAFSTKWWAFIGGTPMLVIGGVCLLVAASIFRRGVLRGFDRPRFPLLLRYLWPVHIVYLLAYWMLMSQVDSRFAARLSHGEWLTWATIGAAWLAQLSLTLLLIQGAVWLVPRLHSPTTRFRIRPLPNLPILQRELFSRAHGPLGRFLMVLVGVWVVVSVGAAVSSGDTDLFVGGAFIGIAGTVLTTTLIITSSIAGARQRATLALLCVTTTSKHKMLFEKVLAAMIRGAIPGILTIGMITLATDGEFLGLNRAKERWYGNQHNLFVEWPYIRAPAAILWFSLAWLSLTLGQASLATRIKNANVVWALNTVLGLLSPFSLFVVGALLSESRKASEWVKFTGELLFPFARSWGRGGVPISLLVSSAAWCAVVALLWWTAVRTLDRHGHRQR